MAQNEPRRKYELTIFHTTTTTIIIIEQSILKVLFHLNKYFCHRFVKARNACARSIVQVITLTDISEDIQSFGIAYGEEETSAQRGFDQVATEAGIKNLASISRARS